MRCRGDTLNLALSAATNQSKPTSASCKISGGCRAIEPAPTTIIANAGIGEKGTLSVDGREIPIESIVAAILERFLESRSRRLMQKLTDSIVTAAFKKVAEVAFRSGFANQSHFCFQFKRIVGVTPRQF
jgi:AraC-like DNA-binding protein